MDAQSYTHRDLAGLLGVSETTIKSYRSKFPTFLPVARQGKPVRLHPEALQVCKRIQALFADGLSILQTTQELRSEFKEYPLNRRLSTAKISPAAHLPAAPEPALDPALATHLAALAQAQSEAQKRMQQLEAEVRNLATMEAASKALVAELLAELRAARGGSPSAQPAAQPAPPPAPPQAPSAAQPEPAAPTPAPEPAPGPDAPTVLTARRIVTVHNAAGPVASYALRREPRPEDPFPEPQHPDQSFLDLPAVILSDRGDFLGLPGGQSLRRLIEVLSPEGAEPSWFQEGPEAWTCSIPLSRAQRREILFERTTTPRGNLVGYIRRMRINEVEATPAHLQEIFRQLRDQLA